ncbi:hypothetical protein F4825DRAFT_286136 [Nemania diffusa]|nr:hypothetical protein F4825DRAFT_286136 [Nemania diffusa]
MPSLSDPRKYLPSRAHPEHRQARKELEKEHSVGLKEVALLGLLGVKLAWNIEKEVQKHEEKREKEEAEQRRREEREHRRREQAHHDRRFEPRRGHAISDDSHSHMAQRGSRSTSQSYAHDPRRRNSEDYRPIVRYDDRNRDPEPQYNSREDRRRDSSYYRTVRFDQADHSRRRHESR